MPVAPDPGRRRKEDLHGLDTHMINMMERYTLRAAAGDVLVIISGVLCCWWGKSKEPVIKDKMLSCVATMLA